MARKTKSAKKNRKPKTKKETGGIKNKVKTSKGGRKDKITPGRTTDTTLYGAGDYIPEWLRAAIVGFVNEQVSSIQKAHFLTSAYF